MMTNGRLKHTMDLAKKAVSEVSSLTNDEVVEALVKIKVLTKDLADAYAILETVALERGATGIVEDEEFQVLIKRGNATTSYDVEKISSLLPPTTFAKIVNIVDKKVQENLDDEQKKSSWQINLSKSLTKISSLSKSLPKKS